MAARDGNGQGPRTRWLRHSVRGSTRQAGRASSRHPHGRRHLGDEVAEVRFAQGHRAEREASPQPIALRRPRLEAHEKSPGRRNREGAEKVREDHQGDKAPPARRPTRKRHNHSLNLWYDCASKRPNGTQFTFLGRFCCFPWFSKTISSSQHLSAEIASCFIEKEGGARQSAALLESLVMPRIRRPRRARRRPRRATTRSRRSGPAGRPRGRSPARTRPTKQPAGDGRDRCDDPVALSRQDQADLGYNSQSSINPSNY